MFFAVADVGERYSRFLNCCEGFALEYRFRKGVVRVVPFNAPVDRNGLALMTLFVLFMFVSVDELFCPS